MSANFNDIVKQGSVKVKSRLGMYQQYWLILRRPSSRGPLRFEKYKNEKASMLMESSGKPVELKDIRSIDHLRKDEKSTVFVYFRNGKSFQIELQMESEAISWMMILQDMCCLSGERRLDLLLNNNMTDTFNVFLLQTPLMNFYGECLLQITSDSIYLLDVDNPDRCLMVWPLPSLRRYSRDETKFLFESGRSCKTGEGIFIFNTIHSEDIYQKVWGASNAIAEAYNLSQNGRTNATSNGSTTTRNGVRSLPPVPDQFARHSAAPPPPARRP